MGKQKNPEKRAELLRSSQEEKSNGDVTLAAAKLMAQSINPNAADFLTRKIVGYYAIRIFHAPFSSPDNCTSAWERIPGMEAEYSATLTSHLEKYLEDGRANKTYPVPSGLREAIDKLVKGSGNNSIYLVIEEHGSVDNCVMNQGECWEANIGDYDSVYIFKTTDGAWPNVQEQEETDAALLAAIRTMTKATHPFELHARSLQYVTDKNEFSRSIEGKFNIAYGGVRRISSLHNFDMVSCANYISGKVAQLQKASSDQAIRELLYAVRLDKSRDDEYFRLWYLRLHQALVDLGIYCQNSDLKDYLDKLRKEKRWKELNDHRNAIAHYETGRADYQKISDLHRFAIEVLNHVWETGPQ